MSCACPSHTHTTPEGGTEVVINASNRDQWGRPIDYRSLNLEIRQAMTDGADRIIIEGVMGQRYIASAATDQELYIGIKGTPGNNLGAFLNGPTIEVFGNAQDMTGNTMSSGRIVIHGNAWDVTGLAARGGRILVKGSSGYRVGIHMKEFEGHGPTVIIGGRAGDYLGEYMAGGDIVVLGQGIPEGESPVGSEVGTGIHGGRIFVRGTINDHQLGTGASAVPLTEEDKTLLEGILADYERSFSTSLGRDWSRFVKVVPLSSRPFRGHFDPTPI
jgi:glutamate synthase domain-containing protein 3